MKKFLIGFIITLSVFLLALLVIPLLFKDQINERISKEINTSVNAQVYYNPELFSLTLFRNFPNMTVSLGDFGVVGKNEFSGDTLISVKEFSLVLDLMSVLQGGKIQINSLSLDEPKIKAQVLANGKASWDITKIDSSKTEAKPSEPSQFSLSVKKWSIKNGYINFVNLQSPMFAIISGLNHEGSGDFTQDIFDLSTKTTIQSLSLRKDSVDYLVNKEIAADMVMNIDMLKSQYTFKDNNFKINDFTFGFDGTVTMPDTNIGLDLKYQAKETSFKSLLSLIPSLYTQDYKDIKSSGTLSFDGTAKGIFNAKSLPSFTFNLKVVNGMFQYPKLPSAVTGINLDLAVKSPYNSLDALELNLANVSMKIGSNPVEAKLIAKGLKSNTELDGFVKAKFDMAEISKAFPMDGLTLKGLFALDAQAKGVYDAVLKKMPTVTASMSLLDGYVKSDKLPTPLDKINLKGAIQNATGELRDTKLDISQFAMVLENEPITASAKVINFDDYNYDVKLKGILDLEKITKIFPLADTKISGIMNADIATKGIMSNVTAKRYDLLPTSGSISLANFNYSSVDLKKPIAISTATMVFSPQNADLEQCQGIAGNSDFSMTGKLENYVAWIMSKGTLIGSMNVKSKLLDANEWMSPANETSKKSVEEQPMKPFAVPTNIDFVFTSNVDKVKYTDMEMTNMKGKIIARKGILTMDNLSFNMLDGTINTSGYYDPTTITAPKYDFKLGMKEISFPKAYNTFTAIQKLAPIAKNIEGNFSTNLNISGNLDGVMKPVISSINGSGLLNILNGKLNGSSILEGVNKFTKSNIPSELSLRDVLVNFTIVNGTVTFNPIDLKVGTTKVNLGGSQSFDGKINYLIKTSIHAGALGLAANTAISKLTGKAANAGSSNINVNIKVGGTMNSPTFSLLGSEGSTVKDQAKSAISSEINNAKAKAQDALFKAKADAEQRARAETERLRADAEQKARVEADRLRAEAEQKAKIEAERLKIEGKKKLENEAKKLKDRFKF